MGRGGCHAYGMEDGELMVGVGRVADQDSPYPRADTTPGKGPMSLSPSQVRILDIHLTYRTLRSARARSSKWLRH